MVGILHCIYVVGVVQVIVTYIFIRVCIYTHVYKREASHDECGTNEDKTLIMTKVTTL